MTRRAWKPHKRHPWRERNQREARAAMGLRRYEAEHDDYGPRIFQTTFLSPGFDAGQKLKEIVTEVLNPPSNVKSFANAPPAWREEMRRLYARAA